MGLINYIKTVWQAGKSGNTMFTPERFNNIENGIEQATNELNDKETRIKAAEDGIVDIILDLQDKESTIQAIEDTMIDVALDLEEHDCTITELQGDVVEIKRILTNLITKITCVSEVTIPANSFISAKIKPSVPIGYTLLCPFGYALNSLSVVVYNFFIDNSTSEIIIGIRNTSSSSITITANLYALCISATD